MAGISEKRECQNLKELVMWGITEVAGRTVCLQLSDKCAEQIISVP